MAMLYCALGTSDHTSLRFTMDRIEVHQVSTLDICPTAFADDE